MNCVSAGFVHRLAGSDVGVDFVRSHGREPDGGRGVIADQLAPAQQADAGEDFVAAAGQEAEHAASVSGVFGFAEEFAGGDHGGIGGEDDFIRGGGDGAGFDFGKAAHVRAGAVSFERRLVHGGRTDRKRDAGLAEDFAAARGSGSEHEHAPV